MTDNLGFEDAFYDKLLAGATTFEPEWMLAIMCLESGLQAKPKRPPSGARGLTQFMPQTLRGFHLTEGQISTFDDLPADEQIDYTLKYFTGWLKIFRLARWASRSQMYAVNLYPKYALHDVVIDGEVNPVAFKANKGLDLDHDGKITQGDLDQSLSNAVRRCAARYNIAVVGLSHARDRSQPDSCKSDIDTPDDPAA